MKSVFDVILLVALPASGKSEIRKLLRNIDENELKRDFHIGKNLQLDDFPYVHIMRRIDDELEKMGIDRIFFHSPLKPFKNPYDWGTLTELINMDYKDMLESKKYNIDPGEWLIDRIETSSKKVGIGERLYKLHKEILDKLSKKISDEAKKILDDKYSNYTNDFSDKTIIIEFARGGKDGSSMPLKEPFGYEYSFKMLDDDILEKAVVLYIWVTPEESRRKNYERANPNDPGSILHHGVPIDVMINDYGCDDIFYLAENSEKKGTITVNKNNKKFHLPFAYFDNRIDKTSFLRDDVSKWDIIKINEVKNALKMATDLLFASLRK